MDAPRLLERESEMQALEAAIADAGESLGSITFIAGEAGAGKTSLVTEIARRAAALGTTVLVGACDPLSTPRPFGPLVDMASAPGSPLRQTRLTIADANDAMATITAVYAEIRSSAVAMVLIFEDLHWVDQGTLDLLRFLGRRISGLPVAVFCTYRDDEVGPDHALRALLGELAARPEARRLKLAPLGLGSVVELVGDADLDPDELLRSTGGNPFFVTEVVAANHSLPGTVRDAVLARFMRLEPHVQRVVEAVAIAPRSLEYSLLSELVPVSVDDIDNAVRAGLLVLDGSTVRFRHDLARVAVEGATSTLRNQETHQKMVALLRTQRPTDLARLAHHASASNDPQLVLEVVPEAAADAAAFGSHKQAAQLLKIALEYAADRDRRAVEMRVERARQMTISGMDAIDVLPLGEQALLHARRIGDPTLIATTLTALSALYCSSPDPAAARAAIDEAIALLEPEPRSPGLPAALLRSSLIHMLTRQHEAAMHDAHRCKELAQELDSADLVQRAFAHVATAELATGDAELGASVLRAAADEAAVRGELNDRSHYLGMLGTGCGERRLYPAAVEALHEAIRFDQERDADGKADYQTVWLARVHFEQGRWEQASILASPIKDRWSNPRSSTAVTAAGVVGRLRVRRGDPGGPETLQQALQMRDQHFLQYVWSPACGLAEYHWLRGDTASAAEAVSVLYDRALRSDSEWARGELAFWMWRAEAIDSPPERCAAPFDLQMRGDWAAAARAWEELACPYEEAVALADGPASSKRRAVETLDQLGAAPAAAYVRGLLRADGELDIPRGPLATTKANPAQLTNRQLEVLVLIADGHTNAAIASELFITKKTVEHHISAVYSKLGVTSRTAAVARGRELGVIPK